MEYRAILLVIWYLQEKKEKPTMSNQPALLTADAIETFVASLRQRAVPLNTIKSYAHDQGFTPLPSLAHLEVE
jgi:hypothetical protein